MRVKNSLKYMIWVSRDLYENTEFRNYEIVDKKLIINENFGRI